jgi:hypothetical protein
LKRKMNVLLLTAVCFLLALALIQAADAQGTAVSIVPSQNTVQEGETLTVNVTISNVQNLYGIDLTVSWNSSALKILNVNDRLGAESYPDGVLHETSSYPIEIAVNETSQEAGTYQIVATSQGTVAPFSGSGIIVSLTFNITSPGQSTISVVSELADHPEVGESNSEPIPHSDFGASVNAAPIPEFPQIVALGLLLVIGTVVLLSSKSLVKKKGLKRQSETVY